VVMKVYNKMESDIPKMHNIFIPEYA
jgi:hypothetical protein